MFDTVFYDDTSGKEFLTNDYKSEFEIEGRKFFSVSQYLKYKEALSYEDKDVAEKILQCSDNKELAKLQIKHNEQKDYRWLVDRNAFLKEAVYAKFKQNLYLATELRHTLGEIIYLSEDEYLGMRNLGKDKYNIDKKDLTGTNQLGYTLMYVRNMLLKELVDLAEKVNKNK